LRRCSDTGGRVVGLLRAAASERRDEALLGRREGASGEPSDREVPQERRASGEPEALQVSSLDLLGDGVAREEREPEPFAGGALDLAARGHLNLDGHPRKVAAETAERVRQQVDAGGGRGAEMDCSGLEARERVELFLGRAQAGERLRRAGGQEVSCLGEPAAATAPLYETLSGCRLEQTQVLARARLADPDRGGRGGDASLPLDLDEQAHARRVPELAQR